MDSTKIILIGAGGHSKVILDIILKRIQVLGEKIEVLGFLDDDKSKKQVLGYPVLGCIEDIKTIIKNYENIKFIIAIGNNIIRKQIVERYEYLGIQYYTVIHPSAVIGNHVVIQEGTVIMANAVINTSTVIGRHVIINTAAVIEHDNRIEDYVHISPGVKCTGNVTVKRGAQIGAGVSIIPNITIGEYSIIGAGSVVIRDIPSYCTAVGIPAKPIKYHNKEEK